jgi:hypothetical protein
MNENWKKWFIKGAGVGVGLALGLAVIAGAIYWYSSRPKQPKPWNFNAIKATYTVLQGQVRGDDVHLTFVYALHNPNDVDYSLPGEVSAELMRKLPNDGGFQKLNGASWGERVIIPAKQTVNVEFDVPIHLSDFNTKSTEMENEEKFAKFTARRLSEMDGLAFFDYSNRYRIDLPNGWPEQLKTSESKH